MNPSNEVAIKRMQTLRNIGPVCSAQLVAAGIDTPEKLKKLGAKESFLRMFEHGRGAIIPHPCYLYALQGAIEGRSWQEVGQDRREEFAIFTRELRESLPGAKRR